MSTSRRFVVSDLPALIAEGRRLIAAATPGPVRAGRSDMISYGADDDRPYKNIYVGAATARRARNDVPDDLAKVWGVNCIEVWGQVLDTLREVYGRDMPYNQTPCELIADLVPAQDDEAPLRAAAREALDVLTRLADSAAYWSDYDVPVGLVADVDAAKARLAGVLAVRSAKGGHDV